ncbi:RNA-binding protein [Tolypothrix sp. NIES-4075]|uniref:RNA recognition motif domain-containing protein n=1 Tax=Tolypothrix sp. NIES-4075 TaxID=2005459 RepID=UPI000B5C4A1B|nr:RNA-binding protein [Tolypothrix sp. NIES-4075]GAX39761.1 RNA-binding protein [Tolypothrix sp. NIES-4075]
MSVRLYIGNLPKEEIDRQELQAVFAEEGEAVTTKLIKDRKTGKCRGFGFLTVNDDEHADQIIEKYNGRMFKDTAIKLEKALPRTKGEENEDQQQQPVPKPVTTSNAGNPVPNTSEKSSRRDKSSKKPRRGGGGSRETSSSNTNDSDAVRPDPRWASELEKLKEMLAAQATN